MFESARLRKDGPTTPSRFVAAAATLGFDGLILRWPAAADPPALKAIADGHGLILGRGVDLTVTDRGEASQRVGQLRATADVLCLEANTPSLQRFVAEQPKVDVLAWDPTDGNHLPYSVAKAASEHGVYLELDLGTILRARGETRSRALAALRQTVTVADHVNAPLVASGRPTSHLSMRSVRALGALADTVDIPRETVEAALVNWEAILERTQRARSDTFIEPGVTRLDNEADDR